MIKKLSTNNSIVLSLLIIWVVSSVVLIYRLNSMGAFASLGLVKNLEYARDYEGANPSTIRLDQSYSQWAVALNGTDPSNYIKTGLGFAEGKGVSLKLISPQNPGSKNYMPYYFQGPGTPIVIGTMIKLFGERSILPYFILIFLLHFITALLTCSLAAKYFKGSAYILGAGVLGLICPMALDYNFAAGLFASEPLAAPLFVIALIALAECRDQLETNAQAYKLISLYAVCYGAALGCAAYFRDIYATFATFSFVILFLTVLIRRQFWKQIIVFVLISSIAMNIIEYPWEKRNQKYFGEFTMSGSNYCSFALWYQQWFDYKEQAKNNPCAGMGMANYLAPEKSKAVLDLLSKNKKEGNRFAWKSFIEAVCAKPWQSISFKLKYWDSLWFGMNCNWWIYAWCLVSTLSYVVFLWLTRYKFMPELWLYPLFLICISPLAHFEHRYAQPFFLFITPIAIMYLVEFFREHFYLLGSAGGNSN